jgi:class 3 adenylate cyclase
MRRTIVELDLKGYSDVARELEENLSAEVVMHFNDQIQTFVDAGLRTENLHRKDAVMATTGDGAILALDSPSIAHRYALAVHDACRLHNYEKTLASAKRWFRVGIATGDLAIETNGAVKRMAGSVIARAVRLETASNVGEILVDTETYAGLSDQQKSLYGPEEMIQGKRNEVFAARRCVAVPGIDLAPTQPAKARSVPAKASAALAKWREKLEYLQEQLAIATSPAQKFELKSHIAEAKEMIQELGG